MLDYDHPDVPNVFRTCGLIIDALLGTGISQPLSPVYRDLIEKINASGKPVLSADIPSGLDGLSGKIAGACVKAHTTVTFGAVKVGLVLYPGHMYAGRVIAAHIGIPFESAQTDFHLIDGSMVSALMPKRPLDSHKGSNGHVLVVAGSRVMSGAACLASSAALRSGSGIVSSAVLKELYPFIANFVPEIISLCLEDTDEGCLHVKHAAKIAEYAKSKNAVALGPGMACNPQTQAFIKELLSLGISIPLVMDADAINILASCPELWELVPENTIITPHPKEMSRLCGLSVSDVQNNRPDIARQFAIEKKVVLVLKGHRTIVATPQGKIYINPTGHPAMATAGMGDVLSGIIASFSGQGLEPWEAAVCGVYIHGLAGELAAAGLCSDRGLLATDVITKIPAATALCPDSLCL